MNDFSSIQIPVYKDSSLQELMKHADDKHLVNQSRPGEDELQ